MYEINLNNLAPLGDINGYNINFFFCFWLCSRKIIRLQCKITTIMIAVQLRFFDFFLNVVVRGIHVRLNYNVERSNRGSTI